jgi:hypothetical protein
MRAQRKQQDADTRSKTNRHPHACVIRNASARSARQCAERLLT